jgi:hypothetical protein
MRRKGNQKRGNYDGIKCEWLNWKDRAASGMTFYNSGAPLVQATYMMYRKLVALAACTLAIHG